MNESCKECRFYRFGGVVSGGMRYGRCKRYPPEVTPSCEAGEWPLVRESDWCGEFQSKPSIGAEVKA